MRRHWLLIAMGLLIWFCARANAAVLCRDQSGGVFVREACRKAETRLNTTARGVVGPPGPKGEKGERGPRGQQGPPGAPGNSAPQKLEQTSTEDTQTRPLWWQVWILAGTACVIVFYTIETSRLRRKAQTQTELQLRPFVIFEPADGKEFCIRNIGNNTALNVKVETFALSLSPPVMAAFPRPVSFLRTGEGRPLQVRTTTVDGEVVNDDVLLEILRPIPQDAKPELDHFRPTMTIEFENVTGQRYFVQESLLFGDIEIMKFGPLSTPYSSKLWTVWQKLRVRKREGGTEPTAIDEKEWVDERQ